MKTEIPYGQSPRTRFQRLKPHRILAFFMFFASFTQNLFPAWNSPEDFELSSPEKNPVTGKPAGNGLIYGSPVKVFFGAVVRFYQKNISRRRLSSCPSYPTCSRFGHLSVSKYGFIGVLMTVDRIYYRENSSMPKYYLKKEIDGAMKFYDPPANNYIFQGE